MFFFYLDFMRQNTMDRFSRKVQWDVKRSVFIASSFYLFYYGGKACLLPFITLYFRQMGLTASQTGLVLGMKSLLWFCVSPIWMALAHRVNKTRTILCYSIFIVIGSNLSLTLLPTVNNDLPLQICLNESPPFSTKWHSVEVRHNITTPILLMGNATERRLTTLHEGIIITSTKPSTTISSTSSTVEKTTKSNKFTTEPTTIFTTSTGTLEQEPPTTTTTTTTTAPFSTTPTTTILKTSTTTTSTDTITTPSIYKMAKSMATLLHEQGITSEDDDIIAEYVESAEKTKNWKTWKQESLVNRIIEQLSKSENSNFGTSGFRRERRWNRFNGRAKREVDNNNTSSSTGIFDAIKNINLTSLSEKKDEVLKNLTHSMKNFAQEITPFISTNSNLFLCVLIIVAAGEILSAPVELVSDNSLYNLLDELDSLNQYGKHRMSALVGAALCGIIASIIVYFSPCFINGTINRFHIHFYLFSLLLGISFMLAPFYPSYDGASSSTRSTISEGSGRKCTPCTSTACSSCRLFLLLITIFVVGITQAPIQNFILWKIQDMEGASELVYGSYVSVNAICAMISSLCGRKLIKVLKPCTVAFISLLSIALQLILYAFLPSPWLIVPLQLLNITGQSFLWTIVTHHTSTTMSSAYEDSKKISSVHVFARASQQRSLHTSYVSVYQGISFSFGSILSGFLYDYFGGDLSPVLIGSGIIVASWGLVFAMYQSCCLPRKLRRKYSHLVSDSESDIDKAENKEFSLKRPETNGNYVSSYYSIKNSKKKRSKDRKRRSRFHMESDSNSSDTDEHDWLKASMKKESRML
uniref:major facilitator superfamily domain-containing protein 6-like protein B n=1 Tax=Styela clava TaxID=7725 RepID=UPI00193A08E8|nr:major facilitator superfamily domain-containing protein 6-like protein B [Styela clava]